MPTLPIIALLLSHFENAGLWRASADASRSFANAAAPVAVAALWQGAVVAAGLALCLRLAPRVAAAHRFAAWAVGFIVLVALPFVPALTRLVTSGAESNIGAQLPSPAAHAWMAHPLLEISDRWSLAIAALWVLLALARAIDLVIHTARLRRLWKSAIPVATTLFQNENRTKCRFELCTTRELDRPSVIGFFAPRILIPEWLMERLTQQELEQVVLHEAEHLRRRDDWTNLLQKLCLVVFPLNPALAFIERRLCGEREMACDEGVVRRTQAPRAYAACLAGLAERHMEHRAEALSLGARERALTLGAFERRPELARRVHSILLRRSEIKPVVSRAMLGAVGCALAVGAVALARCPQLVAFVSAEPRVTVETAQIVPEQLGGDKVIAPMVSHFRAINAMAIMPETTQCGGTHCAATVYKTGPHTWESKYRQTAASAPANSAGSDAGADPEKSDNATPQELVVLTAFEQVQASGDVLGDRVVSDYAANTNGQPVDGSAGRVTITRLVFRVYSRATAGASESDGPAAVTGSNRTDVQAAGQQQVTAIPASAIGTGADAQQTNSAAGKPQGQATSKPAGQATPHDANSQISQPHAVALGYGWFVIQL
jgi:beta-lactamase regulating signal transducer with metallopeptidase domain